MFLQKHPVQAIEEGVCHMWTVSAFQQHPNTMIIVDEVAKFSDSLGTPNSNRFGPITTLIHQDATLELRVRTVKYFKDMWQVGHFLEEAAFKNISR